MSNSNQHSSVVIDKNCTKFMQNYFFTAPSRFFPSLTHLISPLFLQLQQHLRPFLESCDYVDSEYTQNWFLTFGGVKKRFQKRNFRQFLTIFEHLRRIFTDQEKAERVVQSIFSFSLTPPNVPVLIPKQFSDFQKIQKNPKKTPYTPNEWGNGYCIKS